MLRCDDVFYIYIYIFEISSSPVSLFSSVAARYQVNDRASNNPNDYVVLCSLISLILRNNWFHIFLWLDFSPKKRKKRKTESSRETKGSRLLFFKTRLLALPPSFLLPSLLPYLFVNCIVRPLSLPPRFFRFVSSSRTILISPRGSRRFFWFATRSRVHLLPLYSLLDFFAIQRAVQIWRAAHVDVWGKGRRKTERERERKYDRIAHTLRPDSHSGHYSFARIFLGVHNCPGPKETRDEKGGEG